MKEQILIIEDDEAFRKTLTNLLKKEGYSVTGVSDGFQAIELAKKSLFELIIADVRLPKGMDGIEAVSIIKGIRPEIKVIVIIITGYTDENAPVRALRMGVDDYLYKPFKMEVFLHSVERNIKMYRLEEEKKEHLEMLEKMNEELNVAQHELIQSKKELEDYSKRLEQKVEERTKQLKETQSQLVQSAKMSTIGQLGSAVAHELNNPIGGILGYAQFILQKLSKPDVVPKDFKTCKQYIAYIEKEAKRCKSIVENLLSFSRKPLIALESVDIKQLIENTLSIIRHQLELQNIKLTTNYEPKLPSISGNVNQLQQVFTNIIINAQHAMPKGGKLNIRVSTKIKDGKKHLQISFKDTGCGIPKKNLEKVFEPFFTTKEDWQSIGLGLSITYQIIKELKGIITAQSKVGKETTFTITLPVSSS
ncbi:Sensor histidine kinase RcsC [subsurface metagenome]